MIVMKSREFSGGLPSLELAHAIAIAKKSGMLYRTKIPEPRTSAPRFFNAGSMCRLGQAC